MFFQIGERFCSISCVIYIYKVAFVIVFYVPYFMPRERNWDLNARANEFYFKCKSKIIYSSSTFAVFV